MTSSSRNAAEIVRVAQAAALDDSLWTDWTERMVHHLDAAGGTLFVIDAANSSLHRMLPLWKSPRIEAEYFGHYWQNDPMVDLVAQSIGPTIAGNADHLDEANPATAEYMRWYRGVGGFDEHVLAITPLGDTSFRAGVALHKDTGAGPFDHRQRAKLSTLFPEMARAMDLGFHHAELLEEGYWEGVSALADADAVFLLDDHARVIRMNPAAERLIGSNEGLVMRGHRLTCHSPKAADALAGLISRATDRANALSGALQIPTRTGGRPHATTVYPLAWQRRWLAPFQAAALVRVSGSAFAAERFFAVVSGLYNLTPREAELCDLLCQGHSPESAAAVLKITLGTTRVHLKHIMLKTGTSRQGELVALLLRAVR